MTDDFTFDAGVSEEREQFLRDGLIAYNKSHFPFWQQNYEGSYVAAPLHLFIMDTAGQVIGGFIGTTHELPQWLKVDILWIEEEFRG